jgi:hypothetical protein
MNPFIILNAFSNYLVKEMHLSHPFPVNLEFEFERDLEVLREVVAFLCLFMT